MKHLIKTMAFTLLGLVLSVNVWGTDVTLDFEGTGTFPYNSDWTLSNGSAYTSSQHGGSNSCVCGSTSFELKYNVKIKGTITNVHYWASKTSSNATAAPMLFQYSTDGNNWTSVSSAEFNLASTTNGKWSEVNKDVEIDLSSGGYVRFKRGGSSTAQRLIDDITITYTVASSDPYTVTIKDGSDNTLSTLTESTAGAGVTLPNQTTTCEDWTFLGYSETKFASETQDPATEPTIIDEGTYKPTKNITLYPVFKKTESTGGTSASYQITYKKGSDDSGTTGAAIEDGSDYASLSSKTNAYQRTNGMHLSSGKNAGNATLTLTNAGKVKASSVVTNALAKSEKSYTIKVTYTDDTYKEQSFTPGTTTCDKTLDLDNTKTISSIYYSANSGSGVGIASTTVNYTNSETHNYYITTPSCAAPRVLDHIAVTGTPATFWKGDEFNHTGMTVKAYYTEGDPDDVTSKAEFSTPDMTTAGEKTITVTYKEKTATYTITVKTIANTAETAYTTAKAIEIIDACKDLATQVFITGTVSSIVTAFSESFGNISFNVSDDGETTGDQFQFYRNFKGADKTKWTSADEAPQVGDEVIGYGTLAKHSSTYEFAEGNYIVSLTRPKKLTSITISRDPAQETIFDTETPFDHNGISVIAHYNTGESDNTDVTENAEFTAPDMTTTGEKTVNVSYTENEITKETSYKINVGSHCNTPVTITKGTPEHGSFTLSAEGNQCADGLVVTVTPNAAEHYHFKQITATNGDVDDNAKTVSNITANTTINVEFEEDEKVTVKWHVGTAAPVETANVYIGTAFADVKANAPSVADNAAGDCANKFMGWATSAITDQDGVDEDAVAWATEPISNENKDFYAVWAKVTGSTSSDPAVTFDFTDSGWGFPSDYQEATATYTNGGYSIDLTGSTGNGYKQGTKSVSGGGTENVSIIIGKNGAKILLPQFTFPVSKIVCDGYSGGGTNVQYNVFAGDQAVSTAKTGCQQNGYEFAIAEDAQSSQLTLKVISAHNLQISKMYFYAGASYSNYITSCFVPTYSVTIQSNNNTMGTAAINPEHIKDAYEQGDELEVNATVTESELYRFVNWTIEPATTGASLYMGANEAENLLIVGTGDITLTANFEEIPADPITVTLEVGEHGTLDCDDCVNNTITEETAGDGVLVPDVIANEGWAFLGWSTSSTATEAQYKPADADIFYPSDDNKTLYAVYAQLYKVTLKYTDEVKWQTTAGGAIALPTDRNCKNETYKDHFAGWSETEFAEETTNPTETPTIYAESITPTKDIVLYPVFSVSTMGGTKWVKKTGDQVTEGVYAIITADGYAFNGTISSGHGQVTTNAFAFMNDVATSAPSGTCEITMQAVTGGFKMYNADKGYLYATAASSGKLAWDTQGTTATYWSWASDNWMYAGVTNARIRDYNNTIRTYGSNNGDVLQFAKKESVAENKYWSKPANDVTNPELDLAAGDYLAPQTIKITAATYQSDYAYRYTIDGSAPSKSSTVYDHESGIKLETANTYTVKVIGYDEDNYETQIASATYVLYPVFNSISDMYAGATNDKPVGLVLTNAYVHAVNTVNTNSQIFVQQGDLGVVLSVPAANVPIGVEAGKQISGTAIGKYTISNGRPQISQFAFQSTFSVSAGSRPEPTTITQTTADLVSTHLLRLVKLEGVYAQSDASNIIVVNSNREGTGTASNVYDFFNKVSTIPANDIECNVIGLFNERKGDKDPEIVYSIMPVLATDFDVVEKQNATLPTVNPLGSTIEAEPTKVASGETVTITPAAGFTTSYTVNGGEKQIITAQSAPVVITESNTTIVVEATRPYYNDASATYYYEIDPGLTKYHITLPSVQTYYKIVSDVTDQKAGETVTLTISNITEHWNITGVTVEKADDATTTVEVANPETNIYTFVMPAYAVNVKVDYESDPTYKIDYLKGLSSGVTGDDITESKQYAGVELALKECTWKAAGYTFKNWYAYYLDDESQEVAITITDNKIIVPAHDVKIKAMWDEAAWHKDGTWELVTKTSELGVGDYVIFTDTLSTAETRNAGSSTVNTANKNLKATSNISIEGNKLTRTNNDATMIFQIETGNETNTYAFYADGIGYLNANGTGTNNYMITTESKASVNASWEVKSIYAPTGGATVQAKSDNRNLMQLNGSIFAAYGSKQKGLAIYKFYPKAWTVTFDDNVEDEEIEVPEMQRADPTTNKVTISEMVPERTGYDFSIWNSAKGGTGVTSANPGNEITLSANTTLYAQWDIKQYNVAVAEVENVTINAKPYGEADITEGTNADVNFKKSVVLSYSDLNEDYVFKSWKVTKADDETTEVPVSVGASSTTFEVPAYDVKVSAIIESKATTQLTVTYYANGGKNKTAGEPEKVSEQVNWSTTIKFAEHPCPFEKNLCTFVGWNTKADGTGTTYKTQVTVKTDIDLYAMWEASAVEYVLDANETTKVKVQEGVAPAGSEATFETTYTGNFGQLTNTHKGTLTLTGYAGKVITGVKMQMKSNANSGAGTIVIKVGDKEICSTSYAESFGSHSSSYSVAELANFNAAIIGETENITIVVSCTDNSLYINGYTIEYEDAEAAVIRDNLTIGQYTTYCEPYAVVAGSYSGATFWNITEKTYMSDNQRLYSITIEQYEGDLKAGVPYIMLPETTQLTGVQYGEAIANPVEEGNNGLYGTFVDYAFDENEAEARDAQQLYVISNGTLYLCGTGCGVYANRAYIKSNMINYVAPTGAPRRVIGNPNGTPTNLNGLNGNVKAQKALIDGHIYILRDNKMYNAQGLFVK